MFKRVPTGVRLFRLCFGIRKILMRDWKGENTFIDSVFIFLIAQTVHLTKTSTNIADLDKWNVNARTTAYWWMARTQ